jgi:hypothetical protein
MFSSITKFSSASLQINLPGKAKLEEQAQEKFGSIDAQTKQRLQEGRGRFQVFMNLLSSVDEPISSEAFYVGDPQCRCCSDRLRLVSAPNVWYKVNVVAMRQYF